MKTKKVKIELASGEKIIIGEQMEAENKEALKRRIASQMNVKHISIKTVHEHRMIVFTILLAVVYAVVFFLVYYISNSINVWLK